MIDSMLHATDRALTGVIRRLEQMHLHLGRRVARSDDQRHFIIELEHIEDQVAAIVRDSDGPRRIFDASNLIKDLRRAKAKAHQLGFSRQSARTVRARIKAATSTILVDVFDLDPDVLEVFNQRSNNQFRQAMNRLTVKDAFGPINLADLTQEPYETQEKP